MASSQSQTFTRLQVPDAPNSVQYAVRDIYDKLDATLAALQTAQTSITSLEARIKKLESTS